MKKIALFSVLASSLAFGLSDNDVLSLYQDIIKQGASVKIVEKSTLPGSKIEQRIIEIKMGDASKKDIVFSDDKFVFADVIDPKTMTSYYNQFEEKQTKEMQTQGRKNLANLLKTYDKSKIVNLGNDKAKKSVFVFTDPLCPYCRMALNQIEEQLKNSNLKLIFTPIPSHGEEAVAKSLAILKEIKTAKNDKDKIAILRKYYDEKAPMPKNITKSQIENETKIIAKFFQTGAISGVPAYIEENDLK